MTPSDVERVRLGGAWFPPIERRPFPDAEARRRKLQASTVWLSEEMAPRAHRLARVAAERLGIQEPIELYQSKGEHTARFSNNRPIAIELMGDTLNALDDGCLLAVLGHELGHFLVPSAPSITGNASSLVSELTADRFGLLACRDVDAAIRLELVSAGGNDARSIDTTAYLEQCRKVIDALLADGKKVWASSHPEHSMRAYAVWAFSRSDVYLQLTGEGLGLRALDDIDESLFTLLGVKHPREMDMAAPPALIATTGATDPEEQRLRKEQPTPLTLEEVAIDALTDSTVRKLGSVSKHLRELLTPNERPKPTAESPLSRRFREMVDRERKK